MQPYWPGTAPTQPFKKARRHNPTNVPVVEMWKYFLPFSLQFLFSTLGIILASQSEKSKLAKKYSQGNRVSSTFELMVTTLVF